MTSFSKIDQNTRMSEKVTDILLQHIVKNNLEPGDKLPSERSLASMLQVSSRAIRESVKNLEARGIIEIIHGKGSFISTNTHEKFFSSLTLSHIINKRNDNWKIELLDFRMLIETEGVVKLAMNPDYLSIRKLENITRRMLQAKHSGSYKNYNKWDVEFHKLTADTLQNSIISAIYSDLVNLIYSTFEITVEDLFKDKGSVDPHVTLLHEIKNGDTQNARRIIQDHLNHTKQKLLIS